MLDEPNIKLQNKLNIILIIFHLIFILSILLVDGYPQTNDILHIFKITPLDGNLKFINGIYGPGYTYYSLIFSNNLNTLSIIIVLLSILSSFSLSSILNLFCKNLSEGKNVIYITSILFHLILLVTIGFNHSDSIFLLLLYNGLLIFIYGYYFKNNYFLYLSGLTLIGISMLFRHHGPFFVILFFINFLIFEHYNKKKIIFFFKKYFLFLILLLLPTLISQIHLYTIDAVVNWQTSFKLHYFFRGDTWGDWRNLKYVLEAEEVKNFNISQVSFNEVLNAVSSHLRGVLRIIYPFIICFVITFYLTKNKIIIYSFILFTVFILIVLAGYHRGYYPGIFFCFISVLLTYKYFVKNRFYYYLTLILLFGHLIYVTDNYSRDVINRYKVNKDIKNNILPILKKENIYYQNIFSDDYDFYTNRLEGEMHKICNWGGWFLNHPYLKDYYPKDVLLKNDNNYCEVKAFITKDKNQADLYKKKGIFKNLYKTNFYYLLI